MEVDVNVSDQILKPVNEVFAAFVDPGKMSQYFISRASGPIEAGTRVEWEFADAGAKVLIDVHEVEDNHRIVYECSSYGAKIHTTIQLRADDPNITVVTINERKFPMEQEGVNRAMGQTAGWT
jgi:uncharacterized protein YndB with AHSA1/START domain